MQSFFEEVNFGFMAKPQSSASQFPRQLSKRCKMNSDEFEELSSCKP